MKPVVHGNPCSLVNVWPSVIEARPMEFASGIVPLGPSIAVNCRIGFAPAGKPKWVAPIRLAGPPGAARAPEPVDNPHNTARVADTGFFPWKLIHSEMTG